MDVFLNLLKQCIGLWEKNCVLYKYIQNAGGYVMDVCSGVICLRYPEHGIIEDIAGTDGVIEYVHIGG